MSKYIVADDLKMELIGWETEPTDEDIERVIDNMPTADVVEVVRCKDCKRMIPQAHLRYCTVWNAWNGHGDDGFCCYGERRSE